MEFLLVTLTLYRRVFSRATDLALRNWAVLGTVLAYTLLSVVAIRVAVVLGPLGGIVTGLVWAACASSVLYMVEMIVRTSRADLADFRKSFGAYLWDIVGLMFVFWLFFRLVEPLIVQLPQGPALLLAVRVLLFVLFNALPELIYLGRQSSLALLQESYTFIAANWIEWFPANILAALLVFAVFVFPAEGVLEILKAAVLGFLLYFVMVVRGLLFLELSSSTYRGRRFRYRAGE